VATDIVPDRGRNVGENHAHARPHHDQDQPDEALCDQKVNKKADGICNVWVI
jgi:hypothetical protein